MKTWVKILIVVSAIVGTLLFTLVVLAVATPSTTAPEAHKTPVQHASTVQATPQHTVTQTAPRATPKPKPTKQPVDTTYKQVDNLYLSSLSIEPSIGKVINTLATTHNGNTGLGIEVYVKYPTDSRMESIAETLAYQLSDKNLNGGANIQFYTTPDASSESIGAIILQPTSWTPNGCVPGDKPVGVFCVSPVG
jgi:hypothetical protein